MQHAHQKGIIHRDIKPSNILVSLDEGTPVVKVIDFGIAKAIDQKLTDKTVLTQEAHMIGTPLYISPEQAEMGGQDVDTRADIYALGVVLYELLSGTTPFDRKRLQSVSFDEVRRIIREEEPLKPSTRVNALDDAAVTATANRQSGVKQLARQLRGDLDWIVMKALEKDRDRRYETANGFALDVQRYLAHEPVAAGPPSVRYRLRKFVRRNRVAVLTASLITLALVGGIIGTSIGLLEARRQRDEADQARMNEAREKEKADQERDIAQALNNFFLKDLLGQAYTGNQSIAGGQADRNPKITVRELLDRSSKAIEGKFAGQPLVEAAVRQTLAETYFQLGEYLSATPHAERSVALREANLPADHRDTLASRTILARSYARSGKLNEAIAILEQVRDAWTKQVGPDHLDTIATLHDLAITHDSLGNTSKTVELLEIVRDAHIKHFGPTSTETLTTLSNFGNAYARTGKADEAIFLLERVRDERSKQDGPDSPRTLTTMHNLAIAYLAAHRTTQAIGLFEKVRDGRVKVLEADHPDTLSTVSRLANAYGAAGRQVDSIPLYKYLLEVQRKKLPYGHMQTLFTLHDLSAAYWAAGKLEEAIGPLEELRDIVLKKYGPDNGHTLSMLNKLGEAYAEAGKLPQAKTVLIQTAVSIEKGNFQHPEAELIVGNLCKCLELLTQHDTAEVWRRKWLAIVKGKGSN